MARIRTIKPDFFRHSGLYRAERESGLPIRMAFAGLWTACDREGRFKWSPDELKLDCLPYDQIDFADVLNVLAEHGFVQRYEVDGKAYGLVPSFKEHQVINVREAQSKIPAPAETHKRTVTHVHAHGEGKGKGREGKGSNPPVSPLSGGTQTDEEKSDGKPRRGKHPMPTDWRPGDKHFAAGSREGYDRAEVEWQAEQFRDWATAGAKRYADWDAAFRNWIKSDIARRQIEGRRRTGKPGAARTAGNGGGLASAIFAVGAEIQRRADGFDPDGLSGEREPRGYFESQDGIGEPMPTPGDGGTIDGICEAVGADDAQAGGRNDSGYGVPGKAGEGTGGRGDLCTPQMARNPEREVVSKLVGTESSDRHSGRGAPQDAHGPLPINHNGDGLQPPDIPDYLRRQA